MNFGLFRRELLQQFRWDEDLPLCEHRDWYWRVAQSRQWRMAVCHDVSILHHRDRPEGYAGFRNRTFTSYLKRKNGFRFLTPPIVPLAAGDDFRRKISEPFNGRVRRISSSRSQRLADCKPNILLYGVGHSGTSIVAEQLFALGWSRCDADEQFAESVSVRRLNQQILLTGQLDRVVAEKLLRSLPSPWAVKDPRFAEFLPHWLPVLSRLDQPPLLVWLRREVDSVRASYDKRNERLVDGRLGVRGRPVEELCELAMRNFQLYPWAKVSLDVERIADAVRLFDAHRTRGHPT